MVKIKHAILDRFKLIFLIAIYIMALIGFYCLSVVPTFVEYPPLLFSWIRSTESGLAVLLGAVLVQARWRRPSAFYYFILVMSIFFPMCVIYQFSNFDRAYFYVVTLTITAIGCIVRSPGLKVPMLVGGRKLVIIIMVVLSLITYLWLFYHNRNFNFNLNLLYKERIYLREIIVGPAGYIVSWVGKLIVPFLIGISLFGRRHYLVLLLMILQFLLLPLTSQKSYAAMAFVPLLIYWIFKRENNANVAIVCILGGFSFAAMLVYWFDVIIVMALLVQRAIFKPALLNFVYVTVFRDLDPVMLANSSIMPFIQYKLSAPPAFLVGEFLKNSEITRSNTGFLGTGYMHFGLLGPLIFGMVVAFLLKILDAFSKHLPVWLACVFSFGSFTTLLRGGDLLPSLFTNGVLLCLFLIWCVGYRLGMSSKN